mmetsp:Transcript_63302/g.125175  ORF Transcript_63302/g.125175 Transcript_63302/m.125175 type:complete len:562 (-) Transcript_63302:91-1776(-)
MEIVPEEFFVQYPCDARAQDYLKASPARVVARVLQEFKPPREGEADYSALLVTFVRGLRTELQSGGSFPGSEQMSFEQAEEQQRACLEADIEAFQKHYPMDEAAYNYIINSTREVQQMVLRDFKPKNIGEDDYSALLITFTKKCRQTMAAQAASAVIRPQYPVAQSMPRYAQPPAAAPPLRQAFTAHSQVRTTVNAAGLASEIQYFRDRYPFDDEAYNYLVHSTIEVQRQVLREFKPKVEGEADYSALVISFSKRCRSALHSIAPPLAFPLAPPVVVHTPVVHSGPSAAEYDTFRRRYPFDEAAHKYLLNSTPDVQVQAIRTFKPPREGEADYSALFITYTKRCRLHPQPSHTMPTYSISSAPYSSGVVRHTVPPPAAPPLMTARMSQPPRAVPSMPQVDLEGFRRRYPMDDRAFNYLLESPPEVCRQVVETFVPKRANDTDSSAPVIAYAKLCRSRFAEATGMGANSTINGNLQGGMSKGDSQLLAQQSMFCQRFPMDQAAYAFLYDSPVNVISRVHREFKPKREGDTDYSAAVVHFTRSCRRDAGLEMGPAKRPRLAAY